MATRHPYQYVPVTMHDSTSFTVGRVLGTFCKSKGFRFLVKLALVITFLALGWDALAIILMVQMFMATGARLGVSFRGRGIRVRYTPPRKPAKHTNANAPYGE